MRLAQKNLDEGPGREAVTAARSGKTQRKARHLQLQQGGVSAAQRSKVVTVVPGAGRAA
jgi:hypothetical protein